MKKWFYVDGRDNRKSETMKEMVRAEVRALALALSQFVFMSVCVYARDCGLRLQQAVDLTLLGSSQRIQLSAATRGDCTARKTKLLDALTSLTRAILERRDC